MKKSGMIVLAALSVSLTAFAAGLVAAAESGIEQAPVSPALSILSRDLGTVKSGLCGSDVRFCAADFSDVLGVDSIGKAVITSLPDASAGKLMLGSLEVMKNQTVSAENLSALRFVPSDKSEKDCFFSVRTGKDREYDLKCTVRITKDINRAPAAGSTAVATYKNIAVSGKMTAADPEGDALTYEVVSGTGKGLLVLNDRNGGYTYTPMKNYTGRDSFSYRATDAYGNRSETVTVGITVSRSDKGTVFDDMIGNPAHCAAITVSDAGIMTGIGLNGSTLFDPQGKVSRAQFLSLAMKTAGCDVSGIGQGTVSVFADDGDIPAEYRPYVIAAYNEGMISVPDGNGKENFDPRGNITVSDALVMLDGILKTEKPAEKPVFAGSDSLKGEIADVVSGLYAAGIIDSAENLSSELTRADAAVLLCRALERK